MAVRLDELTKKKILMKISQKASNNSEHQAYIQLKEYGCKNYDDVERIKNWLATEKNIKINSINGFLLDCVMYEIRL